jgi:nucleoside-diphosphate-sugar epimerase
VNLFTQIVVRLAQVHNTVKQRFVSLLTRVAREKGVSAYIGNGTNRWAAVHLLDTARLYRLVLENYEPGARYNAVAEEGIPLRQIAEEIGTDLKVPVISLSPEEAKSHFGWLAMFAGMDLPASSLRTQQRVNWRPRRSRTDPRSCAIILFIRKVDPLNAWRQLIPPTEPRLQPCNSPEARHTDHSLRDGPRRDRMER